ASAQPLLNGDTYRQSAPPRMPQLPPKPASLKSAYRSQRPASLPIAITINNGLETQLAVRRFQTELPRRFLIRVSAPSSADVDEVRRALFGHIWMCVRAMLQESVPGAAKAELIDSTSASCLGAHIDVYLEETGVPAMRMPVDIVGSLKHPVQQDHSLGAAKETNSQGQANIRRLQDGFGGGCDPVAVEQAIKALVHQRIAAEPLSQGVGLVIAAEGMVLAERTDRLGVEVSPLVTFGGMAPHPVAAIGFYVAKALTRLAGTMQYNIPVTRKNAVVVGYSDTVYSPAAMMLTDLDATVTICQNRTDNIEGKVCSADIVVVVAISKPEFVKADWIKPGDIEA
ncbi:Fold1p, partial [Linderina macrospora]